MFHNRGGTFSFADGHAEVHRWLDARTTPPFRPEQVTDIVIPVPNDPDVAWLQARTTSPK